MAVPMHWYCHIIYNVVNLLFHHTLRMASAQSVKSVFTNPHPTLLSNNNKYIISMIFLVKCLKRVKHHVFDVKNV